MIIKLLLFCIIQHVSSQLFHEEITPEERAQLFPKATNSENPEYEIVPIYHSRIQKRDANGRNIYFKTQNEEINLWLDPLDGILATAETPVFTIRRGINLVQLTDMMDTAIGTLYEDKKHDATIAINETPNGDYAINGRVGSYGIYIRPIPNNIIYYMGRKRRSLENITTPSAGNVTYHIIQKIPEQYGYLKTLNISLQNSSRLRRNAVATFYPEILVILDYSIFKLLDGNFFDTVLYTLAFFNGVDLKYRSIDSPKIRLNIAGIVIATEPMALEYMNHYLLMAPYDLIVENALNHQQHWMPMLEFKLSNYLNADAALTLTSDNFCAIENGICQRGPIGLASVGGACLKMGLGNSLIRPINGIVHDTASFEGITTAAHELGHLLGINHDGEMNNLMCNRHEGNIMTPSVALTDKGSEWSFCSLQELRKFLGQDRAGCLVNKPKNGKKIQKLLPGELEDANEQCRRIVGTRAQKIDETICVKLFCVNPMNPIFAYTQSPAAEGTPCGKRKICLRQQCVLESTLKKYD